VTALDLLRELSNKADRDPAVSGIERGIGQIDRTARPNGGDRKSDQYAGTRNLIDVEPHARADWRNRLAPLSDERLDELIKDPSLTAWDAQRLDGFGGDRSLFGASWWSQARCRDLPTRIFYPTRGDNFGLAVARCVCARCAVRADCLDYALAAGETVGVWGGLSERERRRLRQAPEGFPAANYWR
jgi:hypothetical protein